MSKIDKPKTCCKTETNANKTYHCNGVAHRGTRYCEWHSLSMKMDKLIAHQCSIENKIGIVEVLAEKILLSDEKNKDKACKILSVERKDLQSELGKLADELAKIELQLFSLKTPRWEVKADK